MLNLGMDMGTATGKPLFTVIGIIAEFERETMLERQRKRIADGKYKGRKPTARAKADEVRALHAKGITLVHRDGHDELFERTGSSDHLASARRAIWAQLRQ